MLSIEENIFLAEISALLRSMGTLFPPVCSKYRNFPGNNVLLPLEGSPSNTFQLGNALGVTLLKNNICCFCCQKLLILSKREKKSEPQMKFEFSEISVKISVCILSRNSIFICSADFFYLLIKSTIVGNKNNKSCFSAI